MERRPDPVRPAVPLDAARPGRRWSVALTAAVLVIAPLGAGCGAGQNTQTAEQVTAAAVGRVGNMSVLDVRFLFDRPVAGDEVYGIGGVAPLAVTLVNEGREADRLVRVSSPIATTGLVVADGLVIPGGQTLTAGQTGLVASIEAPYEDDAGLIALAGLREPVRSGISYPVVFGFERAGDVLVQVPVEIPEVPRRDLVEDE